MRKMIYKLNDGSVVSTMDEAKTSGQKFKIDFEDIPERDPLANMTEKQKARRIAL